MPRAIFVACTPRPNGTINLDNTSAFVFDNDYRAMLDESVTPDAKRDLLLESTLVRVTNRVICGSPRHDLSLAQIPEGDIVPVIDTLSRESRELGAS